MCREGQPWGQHNPEVHNVGRHKPDETTEVLGQTRWIAYSNVGYIDALVLYAQATTDVIKKTRIIDQIQVYNHEDQRLGIDSTGNSMTLRTEVRD